MEIKATALGLVPELDQLVTWNDPHFKITTVEDEGVSVSRFDPEAEQNLVDSERTWMVSMTASDELKELPKSFQFGKPKVDDITASYQRYVDADLMAVEPLVSLEAEYGEVKQARLPWIVAGVGLVVLACLAWIVWRSSEETEVAQGWEVPTKLTPFTVLTLLREIDRRGNLDSSRRAELATSIQNLEKQYFATPNGQQPLDLRELATRWAKRG